MTRRWSTAVTVATVVISVAAIPLIALTIAGGHDDDTGEWIMLLFTPAFTGPGYLLSRRRPDLAIGWMFLLAGLTTAIVGCAAGYTGAALGYGWPGAAWALWVFSWLWTVHPIVATVALFLFPDDRTVSVWWRRAAQLTLALTVPGLVATALQSGVIMTTPDHPDGSPTGLINPLGIDIPGLAGTMHVLGFADDLTSTAATVSIVIRYLCARGEPRRQLSWVAAAQLPIPVLVVFLVVLPVWAGPVAIAQTLLQQIAVMAAILRWRLYGIDIVIRRSVLAAALLAAALGTYAAVVLTVGAVIGTTGPVASAIGAAAAAFAFGPMSLSIRAWVNRIFYGRRDDPYAVVAAVSQQLSTAPGPEDGLRILIETLTAALRIPYAAVLTTDGDAIAEHHPARHHPTQDETSDPRPGADEVETFPLDHHGQRIGTLLIGRRRGEEQLSDADRRLLGDIARQVGAAVHAVTLLHDLRTARTRLVLAREDERRRLQRDLHDGLGPRLTATGLTLDAARNRLSTDPELSSRLILDARAQTDEAITDVRRLVYALGDPALESSGLVDALRATAARLSHPGSPGTRPAHPGEPTTGAQTDAPLNVVVHAGEFPRLPAGVETAAYRITTEAITNTIRHAAARRCDVRLHADTALTLQIQDDGRGLPESWQQGVGLRSIRERAADLGGQCTITSPPEGGTLIEVTLPLPRPDGHADPAPTGSTTPGSSGLTDIPPAHIRQPTAAMPGLLGEGTPAAT